MEYQRFKNKSFSIKGYRIPKQDIENIINYIEFGGDIDLFLTSVFSNNLVDTFRHADDYRKNNILAYIKFMYDYCPALCYGSIDIIKKWQDDLGLKGKNII